MGHKWKSTRAAVGTCGPGDGAYMKKSQIIEKQTKYFKLYLCITHCWTLYTCYRILNWAKTLCFIKLLLLCECWLSTSDYLTTPAYLMLFNDQKIQHIQKICAD